MKIINISDLDPNWNWISGEIPADDLEWRHLSGLSFTPPSFVPKGRVVARALAACNTVLRARGKNALIVSHGPEPAFHTSRMAQLIESTIPHLVYSFNFTDLPGGLKHSRMTKAFHQPLRFVVFSSVERDVYSEYFDIPKDLIDFIPWSVHPPVIDSTQPPCESGDYICAVGSQARDYGLLFEAAMMLPRIKFVVVATPDSVRDLVIPSNVVLHTDIPLSRAHNIMAHSQFIVTPLRDSTVPCGHVTIVAGMFFSKAMLISNSRGVHDYIEDRKTGLFFQPGDLGDLINKIQMLWEDRTLSDSLAYEGLSFAHANCTQRTVVRYFNKFLDENFLL